MAMVKLTIEEGTNLVTLLNHWAGLIAEGGVPDHMDILEAALQLERKVEKAGMAKFAGRALDGEFRKDLKEACKNFVENNRLRPDSPDRY